MDTQRLTVKPGVKPGFAIKRDVRKNWTMYLLLLPAVAFFVVFSYLPMSGIFMAFEDYDIASGLFGSPWVGFKHFIAFFQDIYFGTMIKNTLIFSLLDIIFVFPAPILLALLIHSVRNKTYRRVILTAVYLPYFISLVVVCGLTKELVSGDGIFGVLFGKLHLVKPGTSILGYPKYFRGIIVVTNIWQSVGFNSVIYIAALSGIDECLYEAADIDGAGRFRKVWNISLPSILPTIMMLLILKIGSMLNVNFEKIYLLYSSATMPVAETISTYVYRVGALGGSYSYTTAIGLFNSVLGFILLLISNVLSKRFTESGVF